MADTEPITVRMPATQAAPKKRRGRKAKTEVVVVPASGPRRKRGRPPKNSSAVVKQAASEVRKVRKERDTYKKRNESLARRTDALLKELTTNAVGDKVLTIGGTGIEAFLKIKFPTVHKYAAIGGLGMELLGTYYEMKQLDVKKGGRKKNAGSFISAYGRQMSAVGEGLRTRVTLELVDKAVTTVFV